MAFTWPASRVVGSRIVFDGLLVAHVGEIRLRHKCNTMKILSLRKAILTSLSNIVGNARWINTRSVECLLADTLKHR